MKALTAGRSRQAANSRHRPNRRQPSHWSADKAETLVQVFALKFVSEIAMHIEPAVRPDRL